MAYVTDVPKVIRRLGFLPFVKKLWSEVTDDEVFTWGSALAYSWIFAIFPFLIFLLTLAPYLPGSAKDKVLDQVGQVSSSTIGGQGGQTFFKSIQEVMSHQQGGLLSFGILLALWGASGGMTMTMGALDRAYYIRCTRSFIKQRLIAIAMTIASAILILSVIFLLPIGTALLNHLHLGAMGTILLNIVRYVVAIGLLLSIVAMIYYFGPCMKRKWQTITPGAVFTVAVWLILGFAFAFYVTHFGNFNATYGALGGAIILLLFFYINAVVLLIGAELNSLIDFETLEAKKGATDLTNAQVKAEYQHEGKAPAPKPAPRPASKPSFPPAPSHKGRKILIATTSFVALRWTWKKYWLHRAKQKAQAKAKHRWWPWATT